MPAVGFKPTISAGKRPQTYALECAATGITQCWLVINQHSVKYASFIGG